MPPLLSLSFTGGEPFLREDLVSLARAFCQYGRVRHLLLYTNGSMPERTSAAVEEICSFLSRTDLLVFVSLDGTEELHNELRGSSSAFGKAVETLRALSALKNRLTRLSIGTLTTSTALNRFCLEGLFRFIEREIRPDHIGLNLVRGAPKDACLSEVDVATYERFVSSKRRAQSPDGGGLVSRLVFAREMVGHHMVSQVYRRKGFITPCYGGTLTAVLYERGDVYPCEALEMPMGNIREYDYDFRKLWFSPRANALRRFIKQQRCFCTYECTMTPNILFNPRHYPALAWELLGWGNRR